MNHRKYLISLNLLVLLCSSQLKSQTVNGSILYDNPDKLKPTFFIYPWYLNTWKPNSNSGMIFGFRLYAGKTVDFDLDLQMSYKDRHRSKLDGATFPVFNREEFRVGVNMDVAREIRGLRTRYTSGWDVIPYIMRRQCITVRLGFNHQGSTIQAADANTRLVSYATNDTSEYDGRVYFDSFNCVIGFSFKTIFNAVINVEGRRISTGKYVDLYADAIINVALKFHDIDNATDSGYVFPEARSPFGYRLGCQFHDPSKTNFSFGVEFGSQPGALFDYKPAYFLFKVGLSITGKAKIG